MQSVTKPKKVVIGGYEYPVRYQSGVRGEDGKALYGKITFNPKMEITIDGSSSLQHQKQNIIHESLHGIDEWWGTQLSEEKVGRLARGIYDFIRRNPEVVKWVCK